MKTACREAFDAEMESAIQSYRRGELAEAFRHLEVAHVLGQRAVWPHVRTHVWMLRIGWKRRQPGEIRGQLLRIVLGALGSSLGIVPAGNTGGTDVGMFQRMPVAPALRRLIGE